MAKDILAIQAASVGPERLFSTARYCGGYTRGRLSAESLRQVVFCRYNIRKSLNNGNNLSNEELGLLEDIASDAESEEDTNEDEEELGTSNDPETLHPD